MSDPTESEAEAKRTDAPPRSLAATGLVVVGSLVCLFAVANTARRLQLAPQRVRPGPHNLEVDRWSLVYVGLQLLSLGAIIIGLGLMINEVRKISMRSGLD